MCVALHITPKGKRYSNIGWLLPIAYLKTNKKLISVKGECNLYSACSTLSSIKQITTKCEGSKLGNISHNAAFVMYCFKLKRQNFFNRKCFCCKKFICIQ